MGPDKPQAAAAGGSDDVPESETKLDDVLIKEIEDYLSTVMQNNDSVIEMADNTIKSDGAKCVAAAIEYCPKLIEVRLSNCCIGDSGAEALFD